VGVGLISQMPKVKESSAMVLTRFHTIKKVLIFCFDWWGL